MAVVACHKYRITTHQEYVLDVVKVLKSLNQFEPIKPISPVDTSVYRAFLESLKQTESRFDRVLQLLVEFKFVEDLKEVEVDEVTVAGKSEFDRILSEFETKLSKLDRYEKKLSTLEEELKVVSKFKNLDMHMPLDGALLSVSAVEMSSELYEKLVHKFESNEYVELLKVDEVDKNVLVLVLYTSEEKSDVESFLSSEKVESFDLSKILKGKKPVEAYELIQNQYDEAESRFDAMAEEVEAFVEESLSQFLAYYDILKLEIESVEILDNFDEEVDTGLWFVDGWMDDTAERLLREAMNEIDDSVEVVRLDSQIGAETRTLLRNNALARPFESVTKLMGVPAHSEIDPTPFMAPFFALYFGFALGDAGYGILMTLVTLYLLTFGKLKPEMKQPLILVLYCGLSTILFGILTGGWFGIDLNQVAGPLGETLRSMKKLDLQSSIMLVLVMSLIAGFIQQVLGLLLKIAVMVKQKRYADAVWEPVTLMIFLTVILLNFAKGSVDLGTVEQFLMPALWVSMLLFTYGHGRSAKNFFMRPLAGLMHLFDLTGYLSNTLSYARLLALGLATGVIASVVNLIASILGGDGFFGMIVTVLILIGGHAFNIMLNLLGTFVNVARLQLVEFFPAFYEAKGKALVPISFTPKYIKDMSSMDVKKTDIFQEI